MKAFIILLFLIISISAFAQKANDVNREYDFSRTLSLNLGYSTTSIDCGTAPKTCLFVGGMFGGFYIDASFNMAKTRGEYMDYNTSKTYTSTEKKFSSCNIGINLNIPHTSLIFTPTVGMCWIQTIYQDPVAFDTYYFGEGESDFNIGIMITYYFSNYIGISTGTGLNEKFKLAVSYNFAGGR